MKLTELLREAAPTKPTGVIKPKRNTRSWKPLPKTTRDTLYDLQSPVPSRPAQPPGQSVKLRAPGPAAHKLPPAPDATKRTGRRALKALSAYRDRCARLLDRARALARAGEDKGGSTDVLASTLEATLANVVSVLDLARRTIEGKL